MDEVLRRRLGLPISLSVLYAVVCRDLQVPVEMIGMVGGLADPGAQPVVAGGSLGCRGLGGDDVCDSPRPPSADERSSWLSIHLSISLPPWVTAASQIPGPLQPTTWIIRNGTLRLCVRVSACVRVCTCVCTPSSRTPVHLKHPHCPMLVCESLGGHCWMARAVEGCFSMLMCCSVRCCVTCASRRPGDIR